MAAWLAALAALLLPAVAAWAWLRHAPSLGRLERAGAAFALGTAAASAAFFLWRVAGGGAELYRAVDPIVWGGLAAAGLVVRPRSVSRAPRLSQPRPLEIAALLALLAPAAVVLVLRLRLVPFGEWDAWSIYHVRAAFLAAPSPAWRNGFEPGLALAHPDYPLLVPAAVARGRWIAGAGGPAVPAALSLLFTAATAAVLAGSLLRLAGRGAALAGFALLLVPTFLLHGTAQMADVPLACLVLLACTLAASAWRGDAVRLLLAGVAAGGAAWTKNEGLVAAALVPASYLVALRLSAGASELRRAGALLALGVAPLLAVAVGFKLALAPPGDLLAGLGAGDAAARLGDVERLALVARTLASGLLAWGGWSLAGPMAVLLLAVLAPRARERVRDPAIGAAGLALAGLIAVFFLAYVLSPYALDWHIPHSQPRLATQLWPLAVWWALARRAVPRVT